MSESSPESNDSTKLVISVRVRGQAPCREDHQFCTHDFLQLAMLHVYIYIYIYMCVYVYIYIYIYKHIYTDIRALVDFYNLRPGVCGVAFLTR